MLIPLGHEQTSVRRLPWVTFTIMGLCVVIFILMAPSEHRNQMESFIWHHQALGYFTQHPYLEMDSRFQTIFVNSLGEEQAQAFADHMRRFGPLPPENTVLLDWEQHRFDTIIESYFACVDSSLLTRFGLVPAKISSSALVTYQFLHTGFFHLLFNMLMLFVVGPFIEDVWGRPIFLAFYLAVGAGAGMMFAVRYPELQTPLVGASGAIAGVMGAFLVRYLKSKVRFVVWIGIPIGPFSAPAWIIFSLWFVIQLISAEILDQNLPEGGAVAFWAHVWGFAFGAVFAAIMFFLRLEEKYLHPTIESKVTIVDNTIVDGAMVRSDSGDFEGGAQALEAELKEHPENVDAAMALWNLCSQHDVGTRALPHMLQVIKTAVRDGDHEFAMNHWESLLDLDQRELAVEPMLAIRISEILEADRREGSARKTLILARQRIQDQTPVAVILRIARLALMMDAPEALSIVDEALNHPAIPKDARPELEVARWALEKKLAGEMARQADSSGADAAELRYLQVTVAVPFAVNDRMLTVDVRGTHRQVVFETVQAISVVEIDREGRPAVAVVDLLLDLPTNDVLDPRTIRLFNDSFDPRTLVGGTNPQKAFREFLSQMIKSSQAQVLPDPEAGPTDSFQSFSSLEAYELVVFGVVS